MQLLKLNPFHLNLWIMYVSKHLMLGPKTAAQLHVLFDSLLPFFDECSSLVFYIRNTTLNQKTHKVWSLKNHLHFYPVKS